MKRIVIDVRTVHDIVRKAVVTVSCNDDIKVRDSEQAARHLVEYTQKHGPTLFHFDNGGLQAGSRCAAS
jgi:hypothetical protein